MARIGAAVRYPGDAPVSLSEAVVRVARRPGRATDVRTDTVARVSSRTQWASSVSRPSGGDDVAIQTERFAPPPALAGVPGHEPMTQSPATTEVAPWQFDLWVEAEADGDATPEQLAVLEADRAGWRATLLRLLRDAEEFVATSKALRGDERDQVLADAQSDLRRLSAAWSRFTADEDGGESVAVRTEPSVRIPREREEPTPVPGALQVQVSWEPGRVVAWGGGPGHAAVDGDAVMAMLGAAGAPTSPWIHHTAVPLPRGAAAAAFAAPVGEVLGWLVAAGAGQVDDVAPSVRWLGRVAIWAVELTARGAMVPLLRQRRRRRGAASSSKASFSVRWTPALVDTERCNRLADEMPGSVLAIDPSVDARALTRSALTGMVDAICRDSARWIELPASPPNVRTAADVTEAFLARLDGSAFDAPLRIAGKLVERADDWARSVTSGHAALIVRLDPPDRGDAWNLAVFAPGDQGALVPAEHAIVNGGPNRRTLEDEMTRLERMVPALRRPGGTRRGQVVLSQDEAWELMAITGPRLAAAGFDVRIPELSPHRPAPTLRVFAEASASSVVGASQLADVRWSAVFDDVELTAADIAKLAKEARPLIRSGGRWVAIDRADLNAAAAALAERASTTQLSGAAMLRLALGLEGSPLAGGISVEGGGWAADLLATAANLSAEPAAAPAGFVGDLRSYQAEALAWLGFLDSAGLGGCLALDMGLGKTPTMLAHVLAGAGAGPALGDRAGRGRRQLGRRSGAVHACAPRRRAPRREPCFVRRDRGRSGGRRSRDHHLRDRGARRRSDRRGRVEPGDPRRSASHQELRERHRAAAPPDPRADARRADGHADRERARRPLVDPRLHQSRSGRPAAAVHRAALAR